ncbi:MAG: D-glycero-beta-D-manno-heptose 1-phosphate adenylyltransferase [Chlamydiota bacterium]|nr:D-glycero-beta-D-manno-heptose 1-phosphate adenylyltransferase [Chlamydiota bacterium]
MTKERLFIYKKESLQKILREKKEQGSKVVFTNGCFDVLHIGHIRLLSAAKGAGDILVVALNSDESIRRIKDQTRPIVPLLERAEIIASLRDVDFVTSFDEETPLEIIGYLKPDIIVKGGDYHIDDVVGKDIVLSYGGEVKLFPYIDGLSTSNIIRKIQELR